MILRAGDVILGQVNYIFLGFPGRAIRAIAHIPFGDFVLSHLNNRHFITFGCLQQASGSRLHLVRSQVLGCLLLLSKDVFDFIDCHAVYVLLEHLSESEGLQLELLPLIDELIQLLHLVVGYILALICLLL